MDGLARLVEGLVAAQQQAVVALDDQGLLEAVPSGLRAGLDHQLRFAFQVLGHRELDRQAARTVGLPLKEGNGPARRRVQADLDQRALDRLAPGKVLHDDANRGLAAGRELALPHQDGLLVVQPRGHGIHPA